jgi:opacity protein-like surface antigen
MSHLARLLPALALAALLPAAVAAEDAPPPSTMLWSGPYFGLTFGTGGADLEGPGGAAGSQDGRETSLITGFVWARGALVFGVEYDLTLNIKGDYVFGDRVEVGSRMAAVDWLTSLRGRFGVVEDGTLVYATAGVGYSDTVSTGRAYDTGYVLGAGLERRFAGRWAWRGEALYWGFSPDGATNRVEVDDAWVVRLGLARYF